MTMTDEGLLEKVTERQLRVQERDKQQAQIDDLNVEISTEMALRDVKKLDVGEWGLAQVDGERKSLDPKKLLEAGVTTEQLDKGTSISRFVSLRVTRRGGKP